jgi:hypothetical protein
MADNALLQPGGGVRRNVLLDAWDAGKAALAEAWHGPQSPITGGPMYDPRAVPAPTSGREGMQQVLAEYQDPAARGVGVNTVLGFTESPAAVGKLPMDFASRMERARAQGYDTSRVFYHGTGRAFPEFSLAEAGSGGNAGLKERGVFLSSSPAVSDSYLGGVYMNAAAPDAIRDGLAPMGDGVGRWYSPGSQVLPVHLRNLDDYTVWDMGGAGYRPDDMRDILRDARKDGAPGVLLENIRDPGLMNATGPLGSSRAPSTTAVAFRPNDIRSVFANFDPRLVRSKNFLASGAAGGVGLNALLPGRDDQ